VVQGTLIKQLDELGQALEAANAEKYDIIFRERKFAELHSGYFAYKNCEKDRPAYPVLMDKYQVLTLIGRGGFSEVYKGYDLDNFRYVVIKLHLLNPKWDAGYRDNYVKHARRENDVYQCLNHPNIVQYLDTVEIDELNFATVLEYCDGNDLDY
jgi:tousled-like kinase